MTDTLADWRTVTDAAAEIGCSKRTIERLAAAKKLESRLRPQAGSPHVAVYNPDDVARIAAERRPAPAPFVLGAVTDAGNGNGHGEPSRAVSTRHARSADDDLIRQFFALAIQALQSPPPALLSPPSPPVAGSVAETLYVTVQDAARILGLPQVDVRVLIVEGTLPHRRTGRGGIRIRRRDLEQL